MFLTPSGRRGALGPRAVSAHFSRNVRIEMTNQDAIMQRQRLDLRLIEQICAEHQKVAVYTVFYLLHRFRERLRARPTVLTLRILNFRFR